MEATSSDLHASVLFVNDVPNPPPSQELAQKLESKDDDDKIFALKQLITLILNGESYPKIMMQVIK